MLETAFDKILTKIELPKDPKQLKEVLDKSDTVYALGFILDKIKNERYLTTGQFETLLKEFFGTSKEPDAPPKEIDSSKEPDAAPKEIVTPKGPDAPPKVIKWTRRRLWIFRMQILTEAIDKLLVDTKDKEYPLMLPRLEEWVSLFSKSDFKKLQTLAPMLQSKLSLPRTYQGIVDYMSLANRQIVMDAHLKRGHISSEQLEAFFDYCHAECPDVFYHAIQRFSWTSDNMLPRLTLSSWLEHFEKTLQHSKPTLFYELEREIRLLLVYCHMPRDRDHLRKFINKFLLTFKDVEPFIQEVHLQGHDSITSTQLKVIIEELGAYPQIVEAAFAAFDPARGMVEARLTRVDWERYKNLYLRKTAAVPDYLKGTIEKIERKLQFPEKAHEIERYISHHFPLNSRTDPSEQTNRDSVALQILKKKDTNIFIHPDYQGILSEPPATRLKHELLLQDRFSSSQILALFSVLYTHPRLLLTAFTRYSAEGESLKERMFLFQLEAMKQQLIGRIDSAENGSLDELFLPRENELKLPQDPSQAQDYLKYVLENYGLLHFSNEVEVQPSLSRAQIDMILKTLAQYHGNDANEEITEYLRSWLDRQGRAGSRSHMGRGQWILSSQARTPPPREGSSSNTYESISSDQDPQARYYSDSHILRTKSAPITQYHSESGAFGDPLAGDGGFPLARGGTPRFPTTIQEPPKIHSAYPVGFSPPRRLTTPHASSQPPARAISPSNSVGDSSLGKAIETTLRDITSTGPKTGAEVMEKLSSLTHLPHFA